jgi:uncharacterized repeat protein (TIGR01451 family)
VSPADYYCGSGQAGITSWGVVSLGGAPASSYTSLTVSLRDTNGDPISGFTDVTVPAGQSLDISALPTTQLTSRISAAVIVNGVTAEISGAQLSISWSGEPIQMCFQTVAPPVPVCSSTASVVSNSATAVTEATSNGGESDAPGGNSTGAATFTNLPAGGECLLQYEKSVSAPQAHPGDRVTYTVNVRNIGQLPYQAPAAAHFTDDLSDVLRQSDYGNDASASAGTVVFDPSSKTLNWTGPDSFAEHDTATVTYSVVAKATTIGTPMVNRVISADLGSNCLSESTDPACRAEVVIDAAALNPPDPHGDTGTSRPPGAKRPGAHSAGNPADPPGRTSAGIDTGLGGNESGGHGGISRVGSGLLLGGLAIGLLVLLRRRAD